jgi:mono/diheme cytochrome c family protein
MNENRWMLSKRWISGLAILLRGMVASGAPPEQQPDVTSGYSESVEPFVAQHCLSCHGAKTAKAGYRIDLLGTDFNAASVAEQWKEVVDRVQSGEMPPAGQPRPNTKQVTEFTTWIHEQLREVESR